MLMNIGIAFNHALTPDVKKKRGEKNGAQSQHHQTIANTRFFNTRVNQSKKAWQHSFYCRLKIQRKIAFLHLNKKSLRTLLPLRIIQAKRRRVFPEKAAALYA